MLAIPNITAPTRLGAKTPVPTCVIALFAVAFAAEAHAAAAPSMWTLDNRSISEAIEDEFRTDLAVPGERIDVRTNDGVVTLSGSVDNILAKDRALRLAKLVKGVRAVVNMIEVRPSVLRQDEAIRRDVRTALQLDYAVDADEVDPLTVSHGVVTLSGTVDSWSESRLAERTVKGVRGVTKVVNRLVIKPPVARPDREIEVEVRERLHWDALVDNALIDVFVENGTVRLAGTVGSAAEKSKAIADAWVTGAKFVDGGKLKVALWVRDPDLRRHKYGNLNDAEIEKAVERALRYDPRVGSQAIAVDVYGGIATLRGKVGQLSESRAAAQDAANTVGVSRAINRLKIKPGEPLRDDTIEKRLRAALGRAPFLERRELRVNVVGGIAHLYGEVDSGFEKSRADEVAAGVPGVIGVRNHLRVDPAVRPYVYNPYSDPWRSPDYPWENQPPRYSWRADEVIEQDIERELWWSPFVDADEVTVSVKNGTATLTGTVDSWSERWAARDNAYDGGAVRVVNRLKVRSEDDQS